VNGHHKSTASRDLRQGTATHGQDLSSACLDIVVTSAESLTASRCGIATEAGRILLEGVAVGTITGSGRNHTDGRASAAGIANGLDDCTVASHESRRSHEAESNNGGLGEVHIE
jgi:hypothetical protein